jgi:metal-responsive CopG/Arc/MetJ family transcriptional regulator
MRTTIDIPDALYRRLRARAAKEGRSTRSLILRAVQQLFEDVKPANRHKVTLPLVASDKPGTLHLDNAKIHDLIGFP